MILKSLITGSNEILMHASYSVSRLKKKTHFSKYVSHMNMKICICGKIVKHIFAVAFLSNVI